VSAIEEYRTWAATCSHLPLFFQPWWLDTACGGAWAVVLAKNAEGKIIGVLPYVWQKRWGLKGIDMPALTPYLGPWYDFPEGLKKANRYALEHEVQAQLLGQVPVAWFFRQRWHPQLHNALGFRWQGFQLDIKYTYCIDLQQTDLSDHFTPALRNNIRNARKLYQIVKSTSPESFYALNQLSFAAQKMKMPYTAEQFERLFQASQEQQAGVLYWAIQEQTGAKEAAIWVLWDQHWAYLLASGRSAEAHNGAVAILIEQAIQDAAASGLLVFDFEGSSLKGVEGFFRQFGGELKVGLVVKKWRIF
jgi:Acetyltransferase (GNAT) domain